MSAVLQLNVVWVVVHMVQESRGRLIKTVDKRTIVAVPKGVGVDSRFPFPLRVHSATPVKISIDAIGNRLIVEKWTQ